MQPHINIFEIGVLWRETRIIWKKYNPPALAFVNTIVTVFASDADEPSMKRVTGRNTPTKNARLLLRTYRFGEMWPEKSPRGLCGDK